MNGERVLSWIEGRRDHRSQGSRAAVRLKRGANEILVKVTLTAKA